MSKAKTQNRKSGQVRGQAKSESDPQPTISPGRRWAFRLCAALCVPVALVVLVELGLRVGGFGYPTSFFLTRQINGHRVLTENDQFGLRFFPPELARSPSPLVMAPDKPAGLCRIFVLGESAALGDPEPAFGFGRYLQALLEQRYPNRRFEVICTAMTAINSHTILPIARECARHQGDVWVVYMGNNEFVGPFGPSTVFGPQLPPLPAIRGALALKTTRLGQLLAKLTAKHPDQTSWGGMKMFLDHQVGPQDPRKQKVYQYFQRNLEDILAAARGAAAQVVLSTVAANLRDCPPFASQHNPTLNEDQKARWQQRFNSAVQAQDSRDFPSAVSNYEAAAAIDASFAELQFRWGRCLLALTNLDQAKRHFDLARDCDSLPFRVDTRLNAIIRDVAHQQASEGVHFVDAAAILSAQSPDGIPGKESLFEHVHLNFEGNYQVALALAQSIAGLLPQRGAAQDPRPWASFDDCARRLALTEWDRRRIYESLFRRLSEPPFINQLGHAAQIESLRQAAADARSAQTTQALQQARSTYDAAVAAAPKDLYLRGDFAKLNEDTGHRPAAAEQWRAVRDEIPFAPGPHYYLAKVLGRMGKIDEALQELAQALAIRPDLAEALEEQGRLLVTAKRFDEGLAALDRAAKLQPGNARIRLDRAQALAAGGRRAEAMQQLQAAVTLQPGFWEARYLLGVELAFQGEIRPAAEQFLETVRLNPNYALGHLNLGIALAKLDKIDEAITQFQETLRLDPKNDKAAQYLQALRASQQRRSKTP